MRLETPSPELQQCEPLLARMKEQMEAELFRRASENRIDSYYPDDGPLRRELYPKHLEFFRAGIFYEDLYQLLRAAPVTGLACVIDRPGYNARYREKYGRQRWSLCKSAFTISVERAAKYARSLDCRLRG